MGRCYNGSTQPMLIGLVDCNNFYVSCERLFQPALKKCPIVVIARPNGCIVACSNSVKKIGIKVGMPYPQVKAQLDNIEAVAIVGNLKQYQEISNRVMKSLQMLTTEINVYSIDEAFFKITDRLSAQNECDIIATTIEKWTGIPVSIGASYSMTLAKMATKKAKLNKKSVIACSIDEILELTHQTPVSEIWGIGKQKSKRLSEIGIKSANDYIKLEDNYLRNMFGVDSLRTKHEILGIESIQLTKNKEKKSISSSRVFDRPTNSIEIVRAEIAKHITKICTKSIKQNTKITAIAVKLYHEKGKSSFTVANIPNNEISLWLNTIDIKLKNQIKYQRLYFRCKIFTIELAQSSQKQIPIKQKKTTEIINMVKQSFGSKALFIATEQLYNKQNLMIELPTVN